MSSSANSNRRSEDDIESLAAAALAPPSDVGPITPLSEGQLDDMEKHTDKILSDYKDFISNMDESSSAEGLEIDAEDVGDDNENNSSSALGLASIPEDSSQSYSYSSTTSSNKGKVKYTGLQDVDFSYNYDDFKQRYDRHRYRIFSLRQHIGWIAISIISMGLLGLIGVVAWKAHEKQNINNGSSNNNNNNEIIVPPSEELDAAHQTIEKEDDLIWYDRSTGWGGLTYNDALTFCDRVQRVICPYQAICPNGEENPPYGEVNADNDDNSWVPINNPPYEWVQVGKYKTCEVFSNVHKRTWEDYTNDMGEENSEIATLMESLTRHLACCKQVKEDDDQQEGFGYDSDIFPRPPSLEEDDPSNLSQEQLAMETAALAEQLKEDLERIPRWYGEADGWTGFSYGEGVMFCADRSRTVCSYEEYCPEGPNHDPYGRRPTDGDWLAPVYIDQPLWIGVASSNACIWKGELQAEDRAKVKSILCCPPGT